MPGRPRQHWLADEAVRAFAGALEPSFKFYERPQPEYGIDGEAEEFDADVQATGLHFFVQVKGTDEGDLEKALARQISIDTANYYRAAPMPVLMVRYHAPSGELYVRWFHQYDPYYGRGGSKTLTFRWQRDDVWRPDSPAELVAEARAFYDFRRAAVSMPQSLYLVAEPGSDLSEAEMRIALRSVASERRDTVRVEGGLAPVGTARVEVSSQAIAARLATVTGAMLHLTGEQPHYSGEGAAEAVATDALTLLALAFERVGQDLAASRLAASYFHRSSLARNSDAALALSTCMARSGRVSEAIDLADRLDDPEDRERSKRRSRSDSPHCCSRRPYLLTMKCAMRGCFSTESNGGKSSRWLKPAEPR